MRKESQIISLNLGEKALPHSRSNDLDVFIKYMVHSSREAIWKQKSPGWLWSKRILRKTLTRGCFYIMFLTKLDNGSGELWLMWALIIRYLVLQGTINAGPNLKKIKEIY